jgi:chromosome segregation ATPase
MHRIEANRALAKSTHEFHGRSVEYLDAQTVVNLRQAIAEQQTNVRTLDGAIDSLKGQLQAIMTEGLLLVLQPHGSLASKTEERFAQISTRLAPSEQATKTLSAETQDLARNVQELKTARANDAAKYEESNAALCLHLNLYERKMQDLTHGNIALAERVKDLTTTRGNDAARHEESTAALCSDLKLHERSIEKLTHENTALAEKVKELTAIHATDATKTATGFTQTSAHLGYLDEATTQATAETRMLKDKVQELSLSNSAQEGKINQLESDRNAMLKRMSKTEEDIAALHKTLVAQNEVLDKVISLKLPPDVVSSIELEALRKQVEGKWSTIYNRQAATTASLYKLEANVAKVCTTVEEDMLARANTAQVLLDRLQEISATQSEHHAQCQRSTAEAKEMFNTAAQEVMSQHEKVEADVVNKIVALELKVGKIEAGGDKIQNRMTPLEHGGAELQERYLHLEADTKAMRSQLTTLHSELRPSADTRVVSTSPR